MVAADTAGGVDYWPPANGAIYRYEYEDGRGFSVSFGPEGMRTTWESGDAELEEFSVDAEGDLVLNRYQVYHSMWTDPESWYYDPPVKFIDLPLAVGKQWSTTTTAHGYGTIWEINCFEVVSTATVTVPYGTFEVMELREWSLTHGTRPSETYFLDRVLGPVIRAGGAKLVSVSDTTPIESNSWGSVKALFR